MSTGARRSRGAIARIGAALLLAGLIPLAVRPLDGLAQEGYSADEFTVTRRDSDQVRPRISGKYVVWQDFRDTTATYSDSLANANVYGRDIEAGSDFRVTSNGTAARPAVSGRRVVYTDSRNSASTGLDIRGFDVESSDNFEVSENSGDQDYAAIDGDLVVWQDRRSGNWDIRGRNLANGDPFFIQRDADQVKPAINGVTVVWEDYRKGANEPDIFLRRLDSEDAPIRITDNGNSRDPTVYGDWVAYRFGDPSSSDQRIRVYNWRTEELRTVTDRYRIMGGPRIWRNLVVWSDRRNEEDFNVWGYDIDRDTQFIISGAERDQVHPDIWEKRVVWEDARSTDSGRDIRGASVTTPASATATPTSGIPAPTVGPPAPTGPCFFQLGFATLRNMIVAQYGDIVGQCLENEWHKPDDGNTLQQTAGGLMVWRKADNWTAFTNGSITWLNGPCGLQTRPNPGPFYAWEGRPGSPCI